MKINKKYLLVALTGIFMMSCSNDDEQGVSGGGNDTKKNVKFEIDASNIRHSVSPKSTRAFNPSYNVGNYNIYAFRKNEDTNKFMFESIISTSGWTSSDANKKITGKAELPIGTYKFLTAYGLNQSGLSLPTWAQTLEMSSGFGINYNGSAAMQEIFLQSDTMTMDKVRSYDMGLTSDENETVSSTLYRAVSRVDVMFIKASKNEQGEYTEQAYKDGEDALGGPSVTVEKLELRLSNLRNAMNFFGNNTTGSISSIVDLATLPNFSQAITKGSGTATVVGKGDYKTFDNIQPSELIKGAAHVFGTYTMPYADETPAAGLQIYIKPQGGIGRTISLGNKLLPLERNKVTIVKVFVLDDDDNPDNPDPNVFTTTVKFDVQIVTAWDGYHEVITDID